MLLTVFLALQLLVACAFGRWFNLGKLPTQHVSPTSVRSHPPLTPADDNVSGLYWCVTEANLFVVVACMPAMRPIFRNVLPAIFGSSQDNSYPDSSNPINSGAYSHRRHRSGNSLPLNVMIHRSLDVRVHLEDHSDSDVELVDKRPDDRR